MSKEDELLEGVNTEQDIKILEEFCGVLAVQYLDQIVCDESELYQAIKNIIKAYKELEEENKNYKIINETLNNICNSLEKSQKFLNNEFEEINEKVKELRLDRRRR